MMVPLFQNGAAPLDPGDFDPSLDAAPPIDLPTSVYVFGGLFGCASWLYLGFLVWMAIACVRRDPQWYLWLWIIIIVPIGPVIYFIARWLPSADIRPPKFIHRWTRGREIERLRIAANQIGNAHQFVELGDALRETGRLDDAGGAYQKAIGKDARNLPALWGGSLVDFEHRRFAAAREKLSRVISVDPAYKFGDVSLLYAKSLHALGDFDGARLHLEGHTRRWRHPEGVYLLATLYADHGEPRLAREHLESLIQDLDGAPRAIVRRQLFWKGRARKLLRKLPEA